MRPEVFWKWDLPPSGALLVLTSIRPILNGYVSLLAVMTCPLPSCFIDITSSSPNCYELQNYWRTSYLPLIFLCFNLFLFPNLNVPGSQKDKVQKSKSVPVQLINFIFHVLLRPSHTHLISLNIYIYLFLAMLGLCCCVGFSLVKKKRGWFLIAVHRLLIAVASFVAEHGL